MNDDSLIAVCNKPRKLMAIQSPSASFLFVTLHPISHGQRD